jgi:flavin reductase (DIM6/NTAB) family NADH-FMN oxidoreductase RutF
MSLGHIHHTLLSLVAPRPIAFASTVDKDGRPNLSPFSYFGVFGINPPTLIFSPARSVRNLAQKDTLLNVEEVAEAVVNLIDRAIVEQASLASSPYDRGVNEFEKAGLEMLKSDLVSPPRVAAAPASFECKVEQILPIGDGGGSGNLIICRVVRLHIREDLLTPEGKVNIEALQMVGRMGGNYYVDASGAALFEVEKPNEKKGMGFDGLPKQLLESPHLSGSELARMANHPNIPHLEDGDKMRIEALLHRLPTEETISDAPNWIFELKNLLKNNASDMAWKWYQIHNT